MILSSTSDLIKITTSASADIHVQASWADKTSTSLTAGRTNTTFTSATTKTVVGSPGSSTQRSVHSLHIANVHATDPNTLTIVHYDGTTNVTVLVVTLASGETLEFDGRKFVKYGASSGGGGGDALTSNPLSQFASTTSAQLRGVLSDETGTGSAVFATSPTLVTPVLGAATATSINKVAITAPATGATFTLADGKTYTVSNTLTLEGTDGATLNIGAGGTLGTAAYTASSSYQAADAGLAAIASLTSAADSFPYFTGSGTAALLVIGSSVRTFLATPSSANLRAALTDETGTGNAVFSTAPTLDSTVTIGTAGGTTGAANFRGTTSGVVTLTVAAAAGTHTIKLPIADGTTGQVLQTDGSGQWSWTSAGGGGVTSVAVTMPAEFSLTGSPITSSGTIGISWANQSGNKFLASNYDGSAGPPAFRVPQVADDRVEFNRLFGDGSNGDVTVSTNNATTGPLSSGVLTRDAQWNNLTLSGTARIIVSGYRIRVRDTLDITAAPNGAITGQGNSGGNASGATGGVTSSASGGATIGGGLAGTAGANGSTGAGAQASQVVASSSEHNLLGGTGAAGGASGTGNAGGSARSVNNASSAGPLCQHLNDNFIRGATLIMGGCPGNGGSSGGGDGTGSGGGGGGGAEGGRMVVVYARRVNRGGSTAAGAILSKGGKGGNGGIGSGGTNRGGGGGAGGGTGGVVWLAYSELLGSTATNAIDVSGGLGGDGGAGTGSGTGGNGGNGGAGGRCYLCQVDKDGTSAWSITTGTSPGTTGGTASGTTAGTGGAGVTTQVSL